MRSDIGIFGGTFNPIHNGHLNSMLTVAEELCLDKIKIIPANKSPFKTQMESPSAEQRLEMAGIIASDYPDILEVDDIEIIRQGTSYTIDTILQLKEMYEDANLFLILGADQFSSFHKWKRFEEIIDNVNIIITTRPGYELPKLIDDFDPGIRKFVELFVDDEAILTTGNTIKFFPLKDVNISAKQLRDRYRHGKSISKYVHPTIEKYILENEVFCSIDDVTFDYQEFIKVAADILFSKKGISVQAFNLKGLDQPSEFSMIASGTSTKHAQSLTDYLVRGLKDEYGFFPHSVEGNEEGQWLVVDYGFTIIHIFYDFVRAKYQLEDLWKFGKEVTLVDPAYVNSSKHDI